MVAKTPDKIKRQVIKEWISGKPRDEIAASLGIGTGTVTNIISAWKKQLDDRDYDAVRELAVETRQKKLRLKESSDVLRLYNTVKSYGIKSDDTEDFITGIRSCIDESIPPGDIMNAAAKLLALSREEKVLPEKVPELLAQKVEELKAIESKIASLKQEKESVDEERLAALKQKQVTMPAIEKYINLKTMLKQHNFSLDDVSALETLLVNFKQLDSNPSKIIAKFSAITDLEHKASDLGLRNEQLQSKQTELIQAIKVKQDFLDGLKTQIATIEAAVNSLVKIRAKGVKDNHIISLGRFIGTYEHEIDAEALHAELKEYKSVAAINTKIEKQNKELAEKVEKLSFEVELLKKEKDQLRMEIDILLTTTKKTIEEVGLAAIVQIRRVGGEIGNVPKADSQVAS